MLDIDPKMASDSKQWLFSFHFTHLCMFLKFLLNISEFLRRMQQRNNLTFATITTTKFFSSILYSLRAVSSLRIFPAGNKIIKINKSLFISPQLSLLSLTGVSRSSTRDMMSEWCSCINSHYHRFSHNNTEQPVMTNHVHHTGSHPYQLETDAVQSHVIKRRGRTCIYQLLSRHWKVIFSLFILYFFL